MANSSLLPSAKVKSDEHVEVFPYRILNDLSKRLKVAEATIVKMLAAREALEKEKNDEVNNLKKQISDLVYENNRYHLSISYCTVCTSDDEFSDASLSDEVSIKASTPVTTSLVTLEPSISPVLCSSVSSSDASTLSSTVPTLMSSSVVKKGHAKTKMKSKDKTFISRMVKTLTKLETKYQTPEHKRKKRLFVRKQKTSSIVPKELATIYNVLAACEPDTVSIPDPFPQVRWNDVRFKPALPNLVPCPVHSCSPDPEFYVDRDNLISAAKRDFNYLASQYSKPFGTLPGYKTSLGVVAVPTSPVGGYVYCPAAKEWVLFAEPHSSPASTGRGTRRGGGTPPARRRRG